MVGGQINERIMPQCDSSRPFCYHDVSLWIPADSKRAQGCAPFELFPGDAPALYVSTHSHAYPRDLHKNYKHRCALFHFALLLLCPPLLYFSDSKRRGRQDLVLLPWFWKAGSVQDGSEGGVVTRISLPNLKNYLTILQLLSEISL